MRVPGVDFPRDHDGASGTRERQSARLLHEGARTNGPTHELKDFRRIATRYDKLARNYFSALCLVAAVALWL